MYKNVSLREFPGRESSAPKDDLLVPKLEYEAWTRASTSAPEFSTVTRTGIHSPSLQ